MGQWMVAEVEPADLAGRAGELSAWCDLDPPTERDLRFSLERDSGQLCLVAGDDAAAVVVTRYGSSAVKYLGVAPGARGSGAGSALLSSIEERARAAGHGAVIFGLAAPGYLWPGVELGQTGLETMLAGRDYTVVMWAVNQIVEVPGHLKLGLARVADPADREAVTAFCREHYPHWEVEAGWAFDAGLTEGDAPRCAVWFDDGELLGFACWSVTREGWFGPMATRPDLREGRSGRGVGTGTLGVALAGLAAEGRSAAEISWVGPERFYARVAGARAHRAFRVFSRSLA